jgi:putative addiction module CopG family antidote
MRAIQINLTETLGGFVEERVASGQYRDAGEVIDAGLQLLRERAERDKRKRARLQALIQAGLDDLEAGRRQDVDDFGAWLVARPGRLPEDFELQF